MSRRAASTACLRAAICMGIVLIALPSAAQTQLEGVVRDAPTGVALPSSQVRVLETGQSTWVDEDGRYRIEVPRGSYTLLIDAEDMATGATARSILARQQAEPGRSWPATAWVFDLPLSDRLPLLDLPVGYPSSHPRVAGDGTAYVRDWLRARNVDPDAIELTMPSQLPSVIRVGRRFAGTCRNNPIQRIDEVPIEEYVQGVLYGEIRVFKSAETGQDSAREVFKAFAVAARTYALWFVVRADNDGYDLDDTACNQRYVDDRDPYIEELVAATAGEVLIRKGTDDEFDKFEYAASCGRHSTWPEYQDGYISDAGLEQVCVGNWCGHNDCAAHQDNPNVPGDDRCLVRGICQWGGLERAAAGQDYRSILAHYQPNLDVRNFGPDAPTGGTVRGYVRTGADLETGTPVVGAFVTIDGQQRLAVSDLGYFEYRGVDAGERTVAATAPGFDPASTSSTVVVGEEVWASLLLVPTADTGEDTGPGEDTGIDMGRDADPDTGRPGEDAGADAESPSEDTGPDPDASPQDQAERFPAFGQVPSEGLPDSSCGCKTTSSYPEWWIRRR
jgi:hypothetical protein